MLINLRNALMTGKRLPYDAEVEFLEGTGEQWIDTGILANGEFDIKYTIKTPASFARQFIVGGARSVTQHLNFGQYSPNGNFTLGYLGNYWAALTSVIASDTLYTAEIHYVSGSQTAKLNERDTVSQTYSGTEALNLSIYIFKRNYYGASDTVLPMVGRLYSFQIWQNGILLRDFIPVRKGTVGYLYDRVSGKLFGNAGTGDFVLGPDVVPVEWLGSDGNQYITTDFVPNDSSGIYLKSAPMAMADVVHVGCRSTTSGRWWVNYGGASNINASWNGYENTDVIYASGQVYIVENNYLNSRSFVVDGETKNTSLYSTSLNTTTHPAAIFSANSIGNITLKAKCRVYELRFSQGSAVARKFLPVRVGTDATSWEGAMMDVLTRRVYRNAGTGAFTYGNDLKYPIPAS